MDLLNITNINYEETIKEIIKEVLTEYKDLTREQTCIIFSNLICERLRKKHIMARIFNTKDLGIGYEHQFVLAKEKDYYYLIDLTYKQFFKEYPLEFQQLLDIGYQKVSSDDIKKYLVNISQDYNEQPDLMF